MTLIETLDQKRKIRLDLIGLFGDAKRIFTRRDGDRVRLPPLMMDEVLVILDALEVYEGGEEEDNG